MSSELIFVTGANGFLGSHIIHKLLKKGYRVRGTARGAKVAIAREIFASYGNNFEVVAVSDTATDDISEHLEGVDAVIHAAAALPNHYKGDVPALVNGAIEGAMNIVRQVEKAGIKRILYTSSIVAVVNHSGKLGPNDWNPITTEQALTSPFMAYIKAKTDAERAVWKFSEEHKNIDLTVLNPPYLFGPFVPNYVIPKPDYAALSTNLHLLHFLRKDGRSFPTTFGSADVRDVARIHVEALHSPSQSQVGPKRLPIASPYDSNWKQAVEFVQEAYPELVAQGRLVDPNTAPVFASDKLPVDLGRVEEVTGVRVDSYAPWKETVLGAMEGLLNFEKAWIAKGYSVDIPALEDYGF